jgi:hypothetical protein
MITYNPVFIDALLRRSTIKRAIKICLIVGTVLIALNHGDSILSGNWPHWWKVALTFAVPYSVSSYSTAAFISDLRKAPAELSSIEGRR